jgi:hypothetical protein
VNLVRAIDADALQKEYMHEHDGKRLMLIDVAPTIEPQRKKGKWNFIGDQMFECSECGTYYTQSQFHQMRVRISDTEFPKFCPECGADMREPEDIPMEYFESGGR